MTEEQTTARKALFSAPAHREHPTPLPPVKTDFVALPRIPISPTDALIRFRIARFTGERNALLALVVIDAALVVILAMFNLWTSASLGMLIWFGATVLLVLKNDKLRFWKALERIQK